MIESLESREGSTTHMKLAAPTYRALAAHIVQYYEAQVSYDGLAHELVKAALSREYPCP